MRNAQGRTRKVLATTMVLGLFAGLATIASFAAFSSTTSNGANDFDAGTVHIVDNDGGASVLYNVDNQAPGDVTEACIEVTYDGSLDAAVRLYGSTAGAATLDQYVDITITEGTQASPTFPDCTNFVDGDVIFDDTLAAFLAHSNYGNGIATTDSTDDVAPWEANDTRVYKFTIQVQDDNNANGGANPLSTGNHTFTWEAQNV